MKAGQQARIAREKVLILEFLEDGETHTFREISEATGISPPSLENRLGQMRKEVEYMGRSGNGNKTNSFYRIAPKPGAIPVKMRDYPMSYLQWGGWTV